MLSPLVLDPMHVRVVVVLVVVLYEPLSTIINHFQTYTYINHISKKCHYGSLDVHNRRRGGTDDRLHNGADTPVFCEWSSGA